MNGIGFGSMFIICFAKHKINFIIPCRHLKWKVLDHWRRLKIILIIEKETEERRERWRHKIQELIPDYMPN